MNAIAGGMESSDSDDCEIVFPSSTSNKRDTFRPSNVNTVNINNYLPDTTKTDEVPSPVVKRMKKNYNANHVYNQRQRALKSRSLVFDDLRYAISQGNLESTKQLYESNDIDVDTILKSGWTGLMYACSMGHHEIVDFLLQRHANPNYHKDMFTPLMSICIAKQNEDNLLKCCILLLKYNANVNVHDRHHTTPLIYAAREGHTRIVKLLLEHGANPDASDYRGYTALSWAAYFGHGTVVRLLLETGADRKKVTNMGQTPAEIALDNSHTEVASLFQNVHKVENGMLSDISPASLPLSNVTKSIPNGTPLGNLKNNQLYTKLGELDMFLIGIGCEDLVKTFKEHHLDFHDLLIMDDTDLEKIGIFQAGFRKKILEACKAVHKKEWQNNSIHNLRKNHYISCPDAVAMVGNISKHLKHISTSVVYIRHQIQSQPRILELDRESANIHNLMDEIEDGLKNLHTLKDEMRFLKMHLTKVQDKPEFSSSDRLVETDLKQGSNKLIVTAFGLATVSIVLVAVCFKYPGFFNLQPPLFIRIPFSK